MALKINANKIELVPLKDIKLNPKNRNKHSPEQIAQFVKILRYQGNRNPGVISNRSGLLVAGEGRYLAMKESGETHMPVMFQDFEDEEQEYLYGISDNAIASQAALDLAEIHVDLKDMGPFDLDLLGIKDFQFEPDPETQGDPDAVPEPPKVAKTKRGELWTLGNHRLLIDDCTVKENVERLMGGEKADMVATSPPYTDQRDYKIGDFDWLKLMNGCFSAAVASSKPSTHMLINLGLSHKDRKVDRYWDPWLLEAEVLGWPLFGWYVWDKGSGAPGGWNGRLGPAHEFVFHFNQKSEQANKWIETTGESLKRGSSGKRFRQKDGSLKELSSPDTIGQPFKIPDSVIRINREMSRGIHTENHPAVFPVDLPEFFIKTWSDVDGRVLEPFCGSGSTLIACEKTNRRCFGMEIEPLYGDVILTRWAKYTGKDPVREDGVKWSELNG